MLKNYNELCNEMDLLDGNINRICVTKDEKELESMYKFAKKRLEEIYNYNTQRIKKLNRNKNDI